MLQRARSAQNLPVARGVKSNQARTSQHPLMTGFGIPQGSKRRMKEAADASKHCGGNKLRIQAVRISFSSFMVNPMLIWTVTDACVRARHAENALSKPGQKHIDVQIVGDRNEDAAQP